MSDYIYTVERELKTVKLQRDQLLNALEYILETTEPPPRKNCRCHINPPCSDCVDYGALREAIEYAQQAIAKAKGEK